MSQTTPQKHLTNFFKMLGFEYLKDVKRRDILEKMGELAYMRFMSAAQDKLSQSEREELTTLLQTDTSGEKVAEFLYQHVPEVDTVLADIAFTVQEDVKNDLSYIQGDKEKS